MFFRMLKSDIKRNKGLNIILFIFIVAASVIVFISGVLVYTNTTSHERTWETCRPSGLICLFRLDDDVREEKLDEIADKFARIDGVADIDLSEYIKLPSEKISSDRLRNSPANDFSYYSYYLAQMPDKYDLVFDENDQPFTVESGKVALPINLKRRYRLRSGDIMRIETDGGGICELEISCFYKDSFLVDGDINRWIVSHEDYERLSDIFSSKMSVVRAEVDNAYDGEISDTITSLEPYIAILNDPKDMSTDTILGFLISIFMIIIVVFLIMIIFMITRFTMIADLKQEEKEIGVIRAIGADTAEFRRIFAAKYIVFAAVGGITALIVGAPLFYRVTRLFGMNTIVPDREDVLAMGAITVLLLTGLIILFSFLMMKRIDKISVVDALQGENHGERFGSSSALYLYKRRKMPVPLYIAVSDILKRFRRYISLMIAYTLGISIMLLTFNLRNTVISTDFFKYIDLYQMDFWIDADQELVQELRAQMAPDEHNEFDVINRKLRENDIPAHIDIAQVSRGYLLIDDAEILYELVFDTDAVEKIEYRDGGCAPKLENEVALSYFTANKLGLHVGDIIDLAVYEKEATEEEPVRHVKKLVITGFIDDMESNMRVAAMGSQYTAENSEWLTITGCVIEAQGKEKDEYFHKIEELFSEVDVLDADELARENLYEFDVIFKRIEFVMGGLVVFICALMTYLFMNIFITEDRSEIALMKSIGFAGGSIKLIQLLRIALLVGVSELLALLFFKTAGVAFAARVFGYLALSGFTFLPEYLFTLFIIPAVLFIVIMAIVVFKLRSIDDIAISDITEE